MIAKQPALAATLDFLLRRVAVYLGTREALFPTLMAQGVRVDGWLAVEALYALTRPHIAARRISAVRAGGPSQGGPAKEPDLELESAGRRLELRLRSTPLSEARPASTYLSGAGELAAQFRLLSERPDESVLILVSYPARTDDGEWQAAVAEAERAHAARLVNQVQFQLPGPERVTVSLWRHASAVPEAV